jgi:hypothetical protein
MLLSTPTMGCPRNRVNSTFGQKARLGRLVTWRCPPGGRPLAEPRSARSIAIIRDDLNKQLVIAVSSSRSRVAVFGAPNQPGLASGAFVSPWSCPVSVDGRNPPWCSDAWRTNRSLYLTKTSCNLPQSSQSQHRSGANRLFSVPSAPEAAGVRVWEVMSRGRGPRVGCPPSEGVDIAYPPRSAAISGSVWGTASMRVRTSRPSSVPAMFLARRARLKTVPFSTPGRSAMAAVIR